MQASYFQIHVVPSAIACLHGDLFEGGACNCYAHAFVASELRHYAAAGANILKSQDDECNSSRPQAADKRRVRASARRGGGGRCHRTHACGASERDQEAKR